MVQHPERFVVQRSLYYWVLTAGLGLACGDGGGAKLWQYQAKLGLDSGKDGHGHLEAPDVVRVVVLCDVGTACRYLRLAPRWPAGK